VNALIGASVPDDKKLREYLISTVMQDFGAVELTQEKCQQVIQDRLVEALARMKLILSNPIWDRLLQDILDEITGYCPLQPLLDDPEITESWSIGLNEFILRRRASDAYECYL
jgi:hypothetical protein